MYGTARGTTFGYSLWEFEVYGKLCRNQCGDPSNLTVTDTSANTATLHWQGSSASKFNVQYKWTSDSGWTTTVADTNFIVLTGLSCATDYLFRVQNICNSSDTGNYSPPSGFSTLSCISIGTSGQLCPGGSTTLSINLSGSTYQWQLDTGSGFADIVDNSNYTGTNTPYLKLNNIPSAWYGYQYRCVVDSLNSNPVILTFTNSWIGTADSSWENPANWSCGELPDENTDVIINGGTVIVNSNPDIRSLTLNTSVNFTVNPNFIFTINH